MLGIYAFFLLLTVFSLAAQFVGYLFHLQENAAKNKAEEPSDLWWDLDPGEEQPS